MTSDRKLMLIDGHALVHRAFHALPEQLTTSTGEPTNAVLGFANIVLKEIDALKPTHIIMAMDLPSPTFRHLAYAGYKGTRSPTPLALSSQFERVRQVATAMHIPICELEGYEADDVLGTLSRVAEEQGIPTVIVTGDLDALQLVSDLVHVLTPGRAMVETMEYTIPAVEARYGLRPEQLPDWKALVGDASDNIPGVSSIGAKTASDLLSRYETLEGIFAHLDELKSKQRAALEQGFDQALSSRDLARIVRTAPVELILDNAAHADVRRADLISLFRELEFRILIERIQAMMPLHPEAAPAVAQT
ncbi:MAG: 5'-3' exonuclease, partial [Chloroflexota bacterium]